MRAAPSVVVGQPPIHIGRETDVEVWLGSSVPEHVDKPLVSRHARAKATDGPTYPATRPLAIPGSLVENLAVTAMRGGLKAVTSSVCLQPFARQELAWFTEPSAFVRERNQRTSARPRRSLGGGGKLAEGERRMVDQNSGSWNRVKSWLRQIDRLRVAA